MICNTKGTTKKIGTQHKGDLENIWGYLYEDNLGKVYFAYHFDFSQQSHPSFSS